MAEKEKIRPIYSELQGYLSQAPNNEQYYTLYSPKVWGLVNQGIDELISVSGEDYDRFKIVSKTGRQEGQECVELDTYRTSLGGLISRLHGKYFSDEPAPFSGMPSTVISQTQQQNQSVHVQMLLEVQSKIDQKLAESAEGTKERTFLQKVKNSLSSIKDVAGLITHLMNMAKECGLSVDDLKNLFS